jgi:hypothetical protein
MKSKDNQEAKDIRTAAIAVERQLNHYFSIIVDSFGIVIGDDFEYWIGPYSGEWASFTGVTFSLAQMRYILLNLERLVNDYGSLIAVRNEIYNWYEEHFVGDAGRSVSLQTWMDQHAPSGKGKEADND